MDTLKIVATLVPAHKNDFFNEAGDLNESGTVFERSRNGSFGGPRFMEYLYLDEIISLLDQDFYYVLKDGNVLEHPKEFVFRMIIRRAVGDDFKWTPKFPRYNRMYYLLHNASQVTGPRYFLPGTDLAEFTRQLKAGEIYVPNEKQTYEPYVKNRIAS